MIPLTITPTDLEEMAAALVEVGSLGLRELDPTAPDFLPIAASLLHSFGQIKKIAEVFEEGEKALKYQVALNLEVQGLDGAKTPSGSFTIPAVSVAAYVKDADKLRELVQSDKDFAAKLSPFVTWGQRGGTLTFTRKK